MTTRALFPTLIYQARLPAARSTELNRRLLRECLRLKREDNAGRRWSAGRYPGGYTSYNSLCQMHRISPTFAELQGRLDGHVARYVRALGFSLGWRLLAMTDCWVNVMPRGVTHGLHLHPNSSISGTYYVQVPPRSAGLKFEDPRLERFMAAPPSRARLAPGRRGWITLPARAGALVLFESWLRHEVPVNASRTPRISISFNYHWV